MLFTNLRHYSHLSIIITKITNKIFFSIFFWENMFEIMSPNRKKYSHNYCDVITGTFFVSWLLMISYFKLVLGAITKRGGDLCLNHHHPLNTSLNPSPQVPLPSPSSTQSIPWVLLEWLLGHVFEGMWLQRKKQGEREREIGKEGGDLAWTTIINLPSPPMLVVLPLSIPWVVLHVFEGTKEDIKEGEGDLVCTTTVNTSPLPPLESSFLSSSEGMGFLKV